MKIISYISTSLTLCLLLATSPLFAQILDMKTLTNPTLKEGECHTVADAKVYLKDLKNPDRNVAYKNIISEIGVEKVTALENTSSTAYFFCQIKCTIQSKPTLIWVQQSDRVENFKRMTGFLCTGLDIQPVAVSPTLNITTTVARVFLAVQSANPEVHTKLKSVSYMIPASSLGVLIKEFYDSLNTVRTTYSYANSNIFQEASAELATYSREQPNSWELIKARMKNMEHSKAPPASLFDYKSGGELVDMFFRTHGRFIPYTP